MRRYRIETVGLMPNDTQEIFNKDVLMGGDRNVVVVTGSIWPCLVDTYKAYLCVCVYIYIYVYIRGNI